MLFEKLYPVFLCESELLKRPRRAVQSAIEEAISAEVLTAALSAGFRSRQENTFAEKMLLAMRNNFGGDLELYPGN
jgi:6-phosphogluconate dehydrogenase (decarboxylating)